MKLPPLLLGATLTFWGWQTGFTTVGVLLAVVFEATRLTRFKWESTEDELNRLWNLVTVIFLAAAVFAFTSNEGPLAFLQMFEEPGLNTSRVAGESSQETVASLIQWLPMIFYLFVYAVALSRQSTVTLKILSLVARRQRPGRELPHLANRKIHIGWIFFGICLVASSINNRNDDSFFTGSAFLVVWALWSRRSRRFALPLWACVAGAACLLAFWGQGRVGQLRALVDRYTPQWGRIGGGRTNPDQDRTSLGQIGRLKGSSRIVVRIKPEEGTVAPTLLRTASYRYFLSPFWNAEGPRNERALVNRFTPLSPSSESGDWLLRPSSADQRIQVATYLEGGNDVLPLPMGVSRLENLQLFNPPETNSLGVVRASGPDVVVFDAEFGSDGSIDTDPIDTDLVVSPRERSAIETAVAEAVSDRHDTAKALRSIRAFFQDKFQYSLWQDVRFRRGESATPLARFLLEDRKGHCEYFATATVLMLRDLGIPARYAVGWAVEEPSGSGYVIRGRHAHAWCIYFDYADGKWHEFDTTPASWVKEENSRASLFEFLTDIWQRIRFEFTKWRSGQSHFRDYLWWIIGPMLLFLLYRLLRRKPHERKRSGTGHGDRQPIRLGLDSEFYLVEKKLGELGFVRPLGESQAQFVERAVCDARVASLRDVMFAMLRAHYRLRFDPLGLTREEREALGLRVRDALDRLSQGQMN